MEKIKTISETINETGIINGNINAIEFPNNVSVIPAVKRSVLNGGQLNVPQNLRVSAYCRVSTGDENQQTSYTKQKEFYTKLITVKERWELAGIYADEAISGTSRTNRVQFNQMISDALNGKMDYIITKSISRFARNTVDTLNCVRQLRQMNPPVGVYFEKENIDTLDAKGELILTILSALAQDESRSISENIRWTFQKNFREGKPHIDPNRMLGYNKGANGEWIINQEEAIIVRYIFENFIGGLSGREIAGALNKMGKKTSRNKNWGSNGVYVVLRNEKYVGDCEMQKTITKDFLTHRSTVNKGEAPKYYVRDHHEGIINRVMWDTVQMMLNSQYKFKESLKKKPPQTSPFTILNCGECGGKLIRVTYTAIAHGYIDNRCIITQGSDSSDYKEKYTYSYPLWRCSVKYKNGKKTGSGRFSDAERKAAKMRCPSENIHECVIEQSFMEMLYKLKYDYEKYGQESEIVKKFNIVYISAVQKENNNNYKSIDRLELLSSQLSELEENYKKIISNIDDIEKDLQNNLHKDLQNKLQSEADIYISLAKSLQQGIERLQEEKIALEAEKGIAVSIKKNFDFFLKCLLELPAENKAGMKLNVNGLDTDGSMFVTAEGKTRQGRMNAYNNKHLSITENNISEFPDYLVFQKRMYEIFIESGSVKGNIVTYNTRFGVVLDCKGHNRNLTSFFGFRKCEEDGTIRILTKSWQIPGRKIQYTKN